MTDIFSNITYIQVEALKEGFDFLRNGYIDAAGAYSKEVWFFYFKKRAGRQRIKMIVRPFSYVIEKNGKVVKTVEGLPDLRRYDVEFESDAVIKAVRIDLYANSKLVPSSVLPKTDAGR